MNNKSDGAKQFLKFLGIGYLNALVCSSGLEFTTSSPTPWASC